MAAEERRRVREQGGRPDDGIRTSTEELALEAPDEEAADEAAAELEVSRFQALLQDRRKIVSGGPGGRAARGGDLRAVPEDRRRATRRWSSFDEATWYWVLVAIGFNVLAFGAYVALFRGILGGTRDHEVHRRLDLRASYQITMAGLAATRIFSAAGAGGIVLTYWALRKAGMPRRRAACRMVAFLVLTYFVYTRRARDLRRAAADRRAARACAARGHRRAGGHRGRGIVLFGLIALIPQDFERRIQHFAGGYRRTRYLQRMAKGRPRWRPACAPRSRTSGIRSAALLAVGGAVGFWAANIGVLWASFEAFGGQHAVRGAGAGLLPGHGREPDPVAGRRRGRRRRGHDRGVRALRDRQLGGVPGGAHVSRDRVLAADPAGIVAFVQLRKTVAEWEREDREPEAAKRATLQKVKY